MKRPPTLLETIGNFMGAIAFIILALAPMFALVAISFYDNSPTGDSLMSIAQFLLFLGMTLALIRGFYDMVFVHPN